MRKQYPEFKLILTGGTIGELAVLDLILQKI